MTDSKSLNEFRKNILDFIVKSFDEFERFNEYAEENNENFPDFETFVAHNKKCLSKLNSEDLLFLNLLKTRIKKIKLI